MSASAYSLSVAIPPAGFSVTHGEPVIGGLHGVHRHYFCAYCMSWIFTRPDGLDWFVNVRATAVDEVSWFTPFIETCTREMLPWARTPALYSYPQFPPEQDFARLLQEFATRAASRTAG